MYLGEFICSVISQWWPQSISQCTYFDSQEKKCNLSINRWGANTLLGFNLLRLEQLSLLVSWQFWDDLSLSDHEDEISYQVGNIEEASSLEVLASFLCISCGLEEKELPFFPEQRGNNYSKFRQFNCSRLTNIYIHTHIIAGFQNHKANIPHSCCVERQKLRL